MLLVMFSAIITFTVLIFLIVYILVHGVPAIERAIHAMSGQMGSMEWLASSLIAGLAGIIAGGLVVGAMALAKAILPRKKTAQVQ